MDKREIFHPEKKDRHFSTGAYSDAVAVDGWLYISGQGPIDFTKAAFALGTIEAETALTLHNLRCLVEAAGGTVDSIVKCTVHLADINDFPAFNKIYADFFPGIKPARTTVQSVLGSGIKIEIDAIARLA
jgi:2-iminobutanoate/2-iminopropanoate deaminase